MRKFFAVAMLVATIFLAAGANKAEAAKFTLKTADVFGTASFFYSEEINFGVFLVVNMSMWHDRIEGSIKIDKVASPIGSNQVWFCWEIYLIDGEQYVPLGGFCAQAPVSAISLLDKTGVRFAAGGLDLSCATNVGPYSVDDPFKSSEPKGLDQKQSVANKYKYYYDGCTLAVFGEGFVGSGSQSAGVFRVSIKDPTY